MRGTSSPIGGRRHLTRHGPACVAAALILMGGCSSGSTLAADVETARADLLGYVWDITAADGFRYDVVDDQGHVVGPGKIVAVDEIGAFAMVYHWWSDETGRFTVSLGTSEDLLEWTWRVDLAEFASQPTIAAADDGGFVAAWEQEPPQQDQSHVRLALYPTWDDLLAARPARVFDAERRLSDCAEGTPNIYSASSAEVDFGFHYYAECDLDRQARGHTDWSTWEAETQPLLDRAVLWQGYMGSVGDRDVISFRGHPYTFIEGQFARDDWSSFRVLVYDEATGEWERRLDDAGRLFPPDLPPEPPSEVVFIRTHAGSFSMSNFSITPVTFEGRPTLVMSAFIMSEGSRAAEAGEVIWYRFTGENDR